MNKILFKPRKEKISNLNLFGFQQTTTKRIFFSTMNDFPFLCTINFPNNFFFVPTNIAHFCRYYTECL